VASPVKCDVLVIGGGPAGAAAAITCARSGLSVILAEANSFPRHRPGETLHPGVEPLLEQLGVAATMRSAGFLRHEGVWVEDPNGTRFQPYGEDTSGPWLGFQAPRAEFDLLLVGAARAAGAMVCQPLRATAVIRCGGRVMGAETTAGPIRAAFTLDASGSAAWLARQLAIPLQRTTRRLIAVYGYVCGECPPRDAAPHFMILQDGWLWTSRVRPGMYHWTRLFTAGSRPDRGWLPPEFAGLERSGPSRGADVSWRLLDACAGAGYFVLGDAAAVTDPSFAQGVLRALMSGILAGHLLTQSLSRRVPEFLVAREYARIIQSTFRSGLERISGILQPMGVTL
jgi:flavin-dependent dehydrogenase